MIEYWIEDLFGQVVKPKINTTNTNEKSWKTNIEEQDRVLFLKAIVYPSCNDQDLSNNAVKEMFIVIKNESETKSSSTEKTLEEDSTSTANATINIIKISPETISFGKVIDAEIEIYKDATDKYSVSAWVEKSGKIISEKTKVHLKNKNTLYKFMLPVQIDPNCKEKIKDGDATLIVEGLGLHEEEEFTLEGLNKELCPKESKTESTESAEKSTKKKSTTKTETKEKVKATNQSLPLLSQADVTTSLFSSEKTQKKEVPDYDGLVVYESTSERSKKIASWTLILAFGLLSLILARRK